MKVHGSCHCGHVRYEAEIDPEAVNICHCVDCQKLTGTAYRVSVTAPAAGFSLLSGKPKPYLKKTAESGNLRRQFFCPECGSPAFATADTDAPPAYTLRIGCLEERQQLPPKKRIWCKSALPWSLEVGGLPGIDRQ